MKRVLITRYGAYGDHLHCSFLPRALKERFGVEFVVMDYNTKGEEIYLNNPFIDQHIPWEPSSPEFQNLPESFMTKRWDNIMESYDLDTHIDLQNSIEYGYIAMETMAEYYMSSEHRRKKFGALNYYDQTAEWAGLPELKGCRADVHFTEEEENGIARVRNDRYADYFVVICNLSGTSKHKLFYGADRIIKSFLETHKDAVCILFGDETARKHLAFDGERIINRAGTFTHNGKDVRYTFRQAMHWTKYADLVIGCESGLMVAATALGAPVVQLMTAASIKNHGGDFKNDLSVQSPCKCSPCHKGPYQYFGCPKFKYLDEDYPECIKFDEDEILSKMEQAYDGWSAKKLQNAGLPAVR